MAPPTVGSIVTVKFPFSDLTSDKIRPALVLGVAEFGDLIVCQITSSPYTSTRSVKISPKDAPGMAIESYVRPDKIFTSDRSLVVRKIAQISPSRMADVRTELKRILGL